METSKKSAARRARLARRERINGLRACLVMGMDLPWHNLGYHSAPYKDHQAGNAAWVNSICMCNRCVVFLARARGIPFNN
jgi:hypothetical protein